MAFGYLRLKMLRCLRGSLNRKVNVLGAIMRHKGTALEGLPTIEGVIAWDSAPLSHYKLTTCQRIIL